MLAFSKLFSLWQRGSRKGTLLSRLAGFALFALMSCGALAQTGFSVQVDFDNVPPEYAANEGVVVYIRLQGGSQPVSNISFSSTLPSGVHFSFPPGGNPCNGTLSSTSNTFSFAGGSVDEDTTCTIVVGVQAAPATTTNYAITLPLINFTEDAASLTTKASGSFTVDAAVGPSFSDSLPPDGYVGLDYDYFIDVDGTEPIDVTVTGLPPGLTVEEGSQVITGTPTTAGTYSNVHVHASNGFGPDADATYTIVIHPAALGGVKTFAPATVSPGGLSTMTITLTSIAGLTMNNVSFTDTFPNGMIATAPGTSTACNGGTLTVTTTSLTLTGSQLDDEETSCSMDVPVKATVGHSAKLVNTTSQLSFETYCDCDTPTPIFMPPATGTLIVVGDPPAITSALPPDGILGTPYSYQVSVSGTLPITVSVAGLPPGLTFFAGTNVIAGTPTTAGAYPGSITATNGIAPDAHQNYTIVIKNPPLSIVTNTLPPIHGGESVNVPIVAQGGVPPYTFNLLSGALPPGLAFDPQGDLVGVPTAAGTFTFTAQVTDSTGAKATHSYTIVIDKGTPVFAFTLSPNPAVAGEPVIATATLTGGGGAPAGSVQVWVAQTGERCPSMSGDAPIAAKTMTSSLASGQVKFTLDNLGIDHFLVCATYAGDPLYNGVNAGPFDLFVIKGALLPAPSVTIAAPVTVKLAGAVTAQVAVKSTQASAIAPSGNVLLRANGEVVGTLALAGGVATFHTTAPRHAGALLLTASYLGDGAFPPAVAAPAMVDVKAGELDPDPVPTLSDAALVLLGVVLLALGVIARRRRGF